MIFNKCGLILSNALQYVYSLPSSETWIIEDLGKLTTCL